MRHFNLEVTLLNWQQVYNPSTSDAVTKKAATGQKINWDQSVSI